MIDATWDIYSHMTRLGLVVLTSVAPDWEEPDAACQLEVWPADPDGRIAGDLVWSHEFGAGRPGAFRPLVAAERHLALAGALADYPGSVPRTRRDLTHLLRRLADPVAEHHAVTDLLAATTTVIAQSYVEDWGALITTAVDGTAAVTSIGPGTPDYAQTDGVAPWWTLRYDPRLAGKEHASLLNTFATTLPATESVERAARATALAEETSVAFWITRFRLEQTQAAAARPRAGDGGPPSDSVRERPGLAARHAFTTPVPAWSLRLVTTVDPAGAVTSAQHLGMADEGTEVWRVTHPATAWPEEAHQDLVALLTRYEQLHDLPAATAARRGIATALLRQWWAGPPARQPAVPADTAPATRRAASAIAPPEAPPVGGPPLFDPAASPPAPDPTPGWHYGAVDGARWVLWRDPPQPGEPIRVATLRDHAGWPRIWASAERLITDARDRPDPITPTASPVPDVVRRKVEAAVQQALTRPALDPVRPAARPPLPGLG